MLDKYSVRQGEVHICLLIWRSRSEYLYVSSGYDNCRNAQSLSKSRCKASHLRLCGVVVGLVVEEMGGHTSPVTHHRTTAVKRVACPVARLQGQLSLYLHPRLQLLVQKAHIHHVLRLHLVTLQAHLAELRQIPVQHYEKRVFNKQ